MKLAIAVVLTLGLAVPTGRPVPDDDMPFPKAEPADVGIDLKALEKLRERAKASGSDAVVIIKDGKLVADWTFDKERGPIEAMSATKSVVSLAIGRLIDTGKIKSVDQPVADFYPEWRQGRKRQITIRHLLNHTSGLQANPKTDEIYPSPDFVQLLAAELSDDPGAKFVYNNKAVNLLAGIVQRASGRRMDLFLADEVFKPLGITDFEWTLDRAGNPHAFAGLQIRAIDLAKIGQLMLDEGTWRGRVVLSKEWVRASTRPGQELGIPCGLLWWLDAEPSAVVDDAFARELAKFGLTPASVARLEALKGKPRKGDEIWTSLRSILQEDPVTSRKLGEIDANMKRKGMRPATVFGEIEGFEARGYLGQYLVVLPGRRIVAVRQRRRPPDFKDDDSLDSCVDFSELVRGLAR